MSEGSLLRVRASAALVCNVPALGAVVACHGTHRVIGTFLDGPGAVHPLEFHELVALSWSHGDDRAVRLGLDLPPTGDIAVRLRGHRPLCTVADDGTVRLDTADHSHVVACDHDFADVTAALAEESDHRDRTPPLGLVAAAAADPRDRRPRMTFDALLDDALDVVLVTARLTAPRTDEHGHHSARHVHRATLALAARFGGAITVT